MKRSTAAATIAVIMFGAVAAGCSSSNSSAPTTVAQAQSQGNANGNAGPVSTLDVMKCADVAIANLGVTTGSDLEKNAALLKQYNPPENVSSDIDYLVQTKGVQSSDSKTADASNNVTNWVKSLCPT